MSSLEFKKVREDFTCEHCGIFNKGNGFTNHCTSCLWSKHVDNTPGDRASTCMGMMKPVRIEGTVGQYDIIYVCEKCGFEKRNRVSNNDNFETVIAIVDSHAAKAFMPA
jgi:hypothetical protein